MTPEAAAIPVSSEDNYTFFCDREALRVSHVLRAIIDNNPNQTEVTPIKIRNVNQDILKRVLWWAENHKLDEEYNEYITDDSFDAWDRCFFDTTPEVVIELIIAANYLDIKRLMSQSITKLATFMNDMMAEEDPVRALRDGFHMSDLFEDEIEEREGIRSLFVFQKKYGQQKEMRSKTDTLAVDVVHLPPRKPNLLHK